MTIAGNFIAALQQEQRIGNVSSETEQHLKHEFRKLGRDASGATLAVVVEAEIKRLERQAATLRRLREGVLAVVWMARWQSDRRFRERRVRGGFQVDPLTRRAILEA
jgi:hypothetical protein